MEEVGGGCWRRVSSLPTADVIGQPSHSGSAERFHRALNYASLSFHQPQHRRADKERRRRGASPAVVTAPRRRLNIFWEEEKNLGRSVTRSTVRSDRHERISPTTLSLLSRSEIVLMLSAASQLLRECKESLLPTFHLMFVLCQCRTLTWFYITGNVKIIQNTESASNQGNVQVLHWQPPPPRCSLFKLPSSCPADQTGQVTVDLAPPNDASPPASFAADNSSGRVSDKSHKTQPVAESVYTARSNSRAAPLKTWY